MESSIYNVHWSIWTHMSQLCYGLVVIYCIVYHYTKRATLARLLANKSLAIYIVHLNRYFVISLWYYLVVTFLWHHSYVFQVNQLPYKKAKLQARIKPTTLCSAINKENSIEFSLDFLHYLYNYYMVCALSSHAYHVTNHVTSCDYDYVTLSCTPFCVVSPR